MGKRLALYQQRHFNAPEEGEGHIYLPSSLLIAGGMLEAAGAEITSIQDGNLRKYEHSEGDVVAISAIGAPYLPEIIKSIDDLRDETQSQVEFVIGGQVINGLTKKQFETLFPKDVLKGSNFEELVKQFDLNPEGLIAQEEVSLIPMYERIDDETMRKYLSKEFCLYLSQGCGFDCTFCGAVRSFKDPITGNVKKVKEQYRNLNLVEADLVYLIERAQKLGLGKLTMYLSNLDLMQTRLMLSAFASVLKDIKLRYPNFELSFRALATVASFNSCVKKTPNLVQDLVDCGLTTIGFGVDGDPETWKQINKMHNGSVDDCLFAIKSASEFGIVPEVLMVIGHQSVDTMKTLMSSYQFAKYMLEKYGAVPRPHMAKIIPGGDNWETIFEVVKKHPAVLQALDFTAEATPFTAGSEELAKISTEIYLRLCELNGSLTKPLRAIKLGMSEAEMQEVRKYNEGKYDI